ncbi:hypothetical protein CCMA1212_004008 [Trichoderma ghanense]|uniref:Uncharacterized protein n=1 Tax=Trichoderma ghanense TaxID=65468 RepID=A0ABY2H7R8_9HYPO
MNKYADVHETGAHHLLEQVPLTVSPFVSLPTATTLSYNYKTLPSNIPPSQLAIPNASDDPSSQPKPKYVVSNSGHAAHPDDIIASCQALQAHIAKMQQDAERDLRELEERIRERELAEKRRLAPGWLDSDARLLEPERAGPAHQPGPSPPTSNGQSDRGGSGDVSSDEGAQLDRAFGDMALR